MRSGAKIRGDTVRNRWYDTIGTIIRNHPAIFIAAVNGLCLGAGTTLINICDLALMAEAYECLALTAMPTKKTSWRMGPR